MQLNHAGHRTSSLRRSPGPIELMGCLANGSTLGRRALPPWHTGVAAGDRMRGALRRLLGGDTLRRLLGGDTLTQEVSLGPPPCNPFPPLASRGDELAIIRLRTTSVDRHRSYQARPFPRGAVERRALPDPAQPRSRRWRGESKRAPRAASRPPGRPPRWLFSRWLFMRCAGCCGDLGAPWRMNSPEQVRRVRQTSPHALS